MHENRFVNLFIKQFGTLKKRTEWNKIYVGIDIHETILKPTWETKISREFYPNAKEALIELSKRPDIHLIMWTSSLPHLCEEYIEFFNQFGIIFNDVNRNEECENTEYADFRTKLYFNVGLDDKFGFIPEKDWEPILHFAKNYPLYKK